MLEQFGLEADVDLDVMRPEQRLADLTASSCAGSAGTIASLRPDWVLVQGDTTTALCGALAGFYEGVAGRARRGGPPHGRRADAVPRGGQPPARRPARDSALLPDRRGTRQNLLAEGVPADRMLVTGNTVIDALLWAVERARVAAAAGAVHAPAADPAHAAPSREPRRGDARRLPRRARGSPLEATSRSCFPVHREPRRAARRRARARRRGGSAPHRAARLPRDSCTCSTPASSCSPTRAGSRRRRRHSGSRFSSCGTPRSARRRWRRGVARLVGTDEDVIVEAATELLDDPDAYAAMARPESPFGDGHAQRSASSRRSSSACRRCGQHELGADRPDAQAAGRGTAGSRSPSWPRSPRSSSLSRPRTALPRPGPRRSRRSSSAAAAPPRAIPTAATWPAESSPRVRTLVLYDTGGRVGLARRAVRDADREPRQATSGAGTAKPARRYRARRHRTIQRARLHRIDVRRARCPRPPGRRPAHAQARPLAQRQHPAAHASGAGDFAARYGWRAGRFDRSSRRRGALQGQSLTRWSRQDARDHALPHARSRPRDACSRRRSGPTARAFPWAVRSRNLTYVAEHAVHVHERDRSRARRSPTSCSTCSPRRRPSGTARSSGSRTSIRAATPRSCGPPPTTCTPRAFRSASACARTIATRRDRGRAVRSPAARRARGRRRRCAT